jgi:hypothetical protein
VQKVTVAIGPDKGRVFNLKEGAPIVIGRRQAHLLMTDHNVSRHHARFVAKDERWYVVDAGSTNGTFVNGTRITEPTPLKGGDQIQIGRSILIFHGTPAAARKTRPDVPVRPPARSTPPSKDAESMAYDVISGQAPPQADEQVDSLEVYIREGSRPAPRGPRPNAPVLSRRPDDAAPDAAQSDRVGPRPQPVANATPPRDAPPVEPPATLPVSQRPPAPPAEPIVEPSPPTETADDSDSNASTDEAFDVVAADAEPMADDAIDVAGAEQAAPAVERPRGEVAIDHDDGQIDADDRSFDGDAAPDHDEMPHLVAIDHQDSQSADPDEVEINLDETLSQAGEDIAHERSDLHEPIHAANHPDAAAAASWVDADDGGSSVEPWRVATPPSTGAWESPYKLRYDDGGGTALATATMIDPGMVQPAVDGVARPAEEWRTLALAVEAEPTTRVTPPEDEDPFEDDAPRPTPPPIVETDVAPASEVETEAVATAPPPEPETEPEPDFTLADHIGDKDDHGSSSLVYEAEQAAAEFELLRQPAPAQPTAAPTPAKTDADSKRPEQPTAQTAPEEVEDEDYDYYAWEERQRLATRRKIKVISISVVVTALVAIAVSNLTMVWMQLAKEDDAPAPAPTAVTPVPDDVEPAPPVPAPDDPEAREQNMQDIFSAMKRHLPADEQ